ncbi:MAG TPA: AmmeMemoRadiSam system protein B [Candidatus Cloacimonadota bacterium]|nr:AmmeMemoRadiSam system protein B [Candidatus Cloacimonadota bacterium]
MIRRAVYAGRFYPRFEEALLPQIESWTEPLLPQPKKQKTLALVVPHAGYMYSGAIAARAFHGISSEEVDAFIILHPSHHTAGFDYSVSPFTQYETPFGELQLDEECYTFFTEGRNGQKTWLRYHEQEHSMEVQLPLIKHFFPEAKVCPLMLGTQSYDNSLMIAQKIDALLRQTSRRIVVIASTDLSHYHQAQKAELIDNLLAQKVQAGEMDELWELVCDAEVEACGIGGIISVMALNQAWPDSKLKILEYTHSGKVSGDNSQVVGYLTARLFLEEV